MTTKVKIPACEFRSLKRSQINLNPFNPKIHSGDKVRSQLNNLKKIGYLGGIVWNETSGNLIDGHKRVLAYDICYKYDGTPEKDYIIENVGVVRLSDKQEKEQMTYMALDYTKADYSLIAKYVKDIDYNDIGLSDKDVASIMEFTNIEIEAPEIAIEEVSNDIIATPPKDAEAAKKDIKAKKEAFNQKVSDGYQDDDAYIMLSFTNAEMKNVFCEMVGINPEEKIVKGEKFIDMLS